MIYKAMMLSAERVPREQRGVREDKKSSPGCPTLEGGEKRRHHYAPVTEAERRHETKERKRDPCLMPKWAQGVF